MVTKDRWKVGLDIGVILGGIKLVDTYETKNHESGLVAETTIGTPS